MEILTLQHVKKRFGEKQVLNDVTFSVPEHTVFGFVGQNGAGKTTSMKIILGLLQADSGNVMVKQEKVCYGNTSTNRFIGYLPDVPEFYSYMTPAEYLRFCGGITGMPAWETEARTKELLELVGLCGETGRIKGFSRGMKQRLGIAQALFSRPELLICDEPTSALDPVGRKEILDILMAAKEQTTVLFSTHILSDVERICDEVAFLHKGQIVLHASMEDVREIHGNTGYEIEPEFPEDMEKLYTFFQTEERTCPIYCKNREQAEEMLHFMIEQQIPIRRFEKREPTLESLFMEVVGK